MEYLVTSMVKALGSEEAAAPCPSASGDNLCFDALDLVWF